MSQQTQLTPDKSQSNLKDIQFYMDLKEKRENYLDEMKKLYDNILSQGFKLKCLQLSLATIDENTNAMRIILDEDAKRIEVENCGSEEAGTS